ncbi:MAG: histidine kinase N-terminal 7TM domain-containing protein, partial [bacterium]
MNSHTLIPLVATIAYVPLLILLAGNRPWERRQTFFFLFLASAFLWSFSDIFVRSDLLMAQKLLVAKAVLCLGILHGVQYHYFLRTFHNSRQVRVPFAYVLLLAAIVLAVLGYLPERLEVRPGGLAVDYGAGFFAVLLPTIALVFLDLALIARKQRVSADAEERNQLRYLFVGVGLLFVFGASVATPWGADYPLSHLGNFANACVLTYAVTRHRLVDLKILLQRVVTSAAYGSIFVSICLVWLLVFITGFGLEPSFEVFAAALLSTMGLFVALGVQARQVVAEKIEGIFYGERAYPRRRLWDFVTKIYDIRTLEQFGSQLLALLVESLDATRGLFLLPSGDRDGEFVVRFGFPQVDAEHGSGMELRTDSPIVEWLRREARTL